MITDKENGTYILLNDRMVYLTQEEVTDLKEVSKLSEPEQRVYFNNLAEDVAEEWKLTPGALIELKARIYNDFRAVITAWGRED